ncbi:MAG: hypothetical protein J7577_11325 [Sphingobacteriaceae bacterium]|nr:hypothetical protein [Sphingobacteriaceae bacterium]
MTTRVSRFIVWSAGHVLHTKFLPVFRLYASQTRTSLLQSNAATGAKWPMQYFIFLALQGAQTFVPKPPRTTNRSFPDSIPNTYAEMLTISEYL